LFTLAFLALVAPASADDVARFRALVGERLRPLRVVVVLDRVWCIWLCHVVVVGVSGWCWF